ncbi:MAG: hypothetical protein IKR41_03035 [Bacteroidales bacterium]|nr:hypothetical protein [Bacteroidales bacterium]
MIATDLETFHFPTPETPEEAMKEMEEIEAEIRAGKVITLEEFMARHEKMLLQKIEK